MSFTPSLKISVGQDAKQIKFYDRSNWTDGDAPGQNEISQVHIKISGDNLESDITYNLDFSGSPNDWDKILDNGGITLDLTDFDSSVEFLEDGYYEFEYYMFDYVDVEQHTNTISKGSVAYAQLKARRWPLQYTTVDPDYKQNLYGTYLWILLEQARNDGALGQKTQFADKITRINEIFNMSNITDDDID